MSCHHTKDHNGNKGLPLEIVYFAMYAFLNQNKSIYQNI